MGTDDSEKSKVFPPESWEADRVVRYQIGPLTESFHRSVPSLKYLNWTIEEIERGYAATRLPLNVESSNQYITQQAALMLLAADYTGGIALSTLFRETLGLEFVASGTGKVGQVTSRVVFEECVPGLDCVNLVCMVIGGIVTHVLSNDTRVGCNNRH